jgi:hypothetical protein
MATALLSTTYFGPVQWYQKLHRYEQVIIDRHEPYLKQTYRNRCLIATTQGVQALTVPVSLECKLPRVSDHGNWRHLHWQALQSAYGESSFFEYYEDDLRPFFTERWEYLYDFNDAICRKMCELLDLHPQLSPLNSQLSPLTSHLSPPASDFRTAITPKHPLPDPNFEPRPYYQVYRQKHGFLPNLSILDLLLNMGPESIFYL